MSEPYLGEIRMFGGNFAPRDWAFCNGQLMQRTQYQGLGALLGTTFGGDQTNFALPNMEGRLPVGQGHGVGLTDWIVGQEAGEEKVALDTQHVESHGHAMNAFPDNGGESTPKENLLAQSTGGANLYSDATPTTSLNTNSVQEAEGQNQPHDNIMPYLCIHFIICLEGVYPSQ